MSNSLHSLITEFIPIEARACGANGSMDVNELGLVSFHSMTDFLDISELQGSDWSDFGAHNTFWSTLLKS